MAVDILWPLQDLQHGPTNMNSCILPRNATQFSKFNCLSGPVPPYCDCKLSDIGAFCCKFSTNFLTFGRINWQPYSLATPLELRVCVCVLIGHSQWIDGLLCVCVLIGHSQWIDGLLCAVDNSDVVWRRVL